MSSNTLANNSALRLGAVALLGGVLVYWLWSSSRSSSPKTPPTNSQGTTATTTSSKALADKKDKENAKETKTETEKDTGSIGSKDSETNKSSLTATKTTLTTTTTTIRKAAVSESESDHADKDAEYVEVVLTKAQQVTEHVVQDHRSQKAEEHVEKEEIKVAEALHEPAVAAVVVATITDAIAEPAISSAPVAIEHAEEAVDAVEQVTEETAAVDVVIVEPLIESVPEQEPEQEQDMKMEIEQEQVQAQEIAEEIQELVEDDAESELMETDEEEIFELVFERDVLPSAPISAIASDIVHEQVMEVEEKQEQEEEEKVEAKEQEHVETEVEAVTPTTLVGEEMDLTKDTHIDTMESTEVKVVESVTSTSRKTTESWASAADDKVQTLQEVSRVAQHSELNAKAPEFKPTWLSFTTASAGTPVEPMHAVTPASEPLKVKSRCRFWPNCTNKSCKFTHPSQPCRDPANCTFGDRCNFIHPNDASPRPKKIKDDKADSRRQLGAKKRRPQSSDSSATMVSVTPEEAWK
ncbi:hypothetical protein BG011_007304 [Mortierella polycephala]|uniref:C3H1-type domain-containing protein n=1 Tax=Mortierella polycephala TaxID=41804 RepID=A0A9P6TXX0_9FUNG|nr:hypothetical protein BG011_007304 [Mortierella polycephala]